VGLVRKFYNYHLSSEKDLARRLKAIIGFTPSDLALYKLAFAHKSTNGDYRDKSKPVPAGPTSQNNERLEFLGDAVLGTIVAEYLFSKYPNCDEGFLTKMRSKLVKRNSLNKIGDKMGLDVILVEQNNTRLSRSMLGNAVEALVGSIYLELGYDKTKKWVIRHLLRKYIDIHELETYDDNYKSQLLEWSQKNGKVVVYKVIAKYKADKRDRFKVAVLIDGQKVATADDYNKKSAEQTASEKALVNMGMLVVEEEEE
jgi:ribonuclease III